MEQKQRADLSVAYSVKTFLADQAAAVSRGQRSPWITPWELASRLSLVVRGQEAIDPGQVEKALQALSIPCAKIAGARRYLLAPLQPANACLTPESFLPTDVAARLNQSLCNVPTGAAAARSK